MKRLLIMTVGKTHSGKTTFAKTLEKELHNSVVIDQDNHAGFLRGYYQAILPKQGQPNKIKYSLTQTIVDYAIHNTDCHLILCNSNLNRKSRLKLLEYYQNNGFISILVNFDIPNHVLKERITKSNRSTTVLRIASTFEEVLSRQESETNKGDVIAPRDGEANLLYTINNANEMNFIIGKIKNIAQSAT